MSEEPGAVPGRLAAGSMLAGYRCEEEIGRGGMAVVYRAHDDHLGRRVALKVLAPDLGRDEVFRARFMQESRIAAATEHPNIIPVFNAGEADGVLYLAMRYVPDGDVRSLIDRAGPLPAGRACALIAQAASALDAAHARGLVHRDVKPTNMLLELSPRTSRPDHLYLSDFGLAKQSAAATGLTVTGQFFGTVDYVAPEQIQSQPLDGRADQYALACTSFEMLTGYPPFKRDNGMAVISAQLSEPPPSLSARRPDLPAAADRVIAKALAKSPADRYGRCLDFAEALLAACRPEAAGAGSGQPPAAGAPHPPTQAAMPVAAATAADAGASAGSPDAITPPAGTVYQPAAAASPPAAPAAVPPLPPAAAPPLPSASASPPPSAPPPAFASPSAAAPPSAAGSGVAPPPSADAAFLPPPPAGAAFYPPSGGAPPPGEQPYRQPGPDTRGWLAGQPVLAGPGDPGGPGPGYPGGRPPRRSRAAFVAGVVALLVVLFFAAAGVTYLVLHRSSTGPSAAGPAGASTPARPASPRTPASSGVTAAPAVPPSPGAPAATVRAYYAAINHHHYLRAWRLGGRNSGSSYSAFVSGYATTAHDTVTIESVSGHVVTAQVAAEQTNGTVKTYHGTYTVTGGVITRFNVQQTG